MNLLTLKTIAYNSTDDVLYSPSHRDFAWSKGVIARACPRCEIDSCDPNCTCGIYTSPNPETLKEYAKYAGSIHVLMNTFGWVDMWTAPRDILDGRAVVMRSWGTEIIGIVAVDREKEQLRALTMLRAAEIFEVAVFPWVMVKKMIQVSWRNMPGLIIHDPYDKELFTSWR